MLLLILFKFSFLDEFFIKKITYNAMPLEQYVIGSVIGKGSYGEVTLATCKKDKKKVIFVLKYSHEKPKALPS